MRLDWEGLRTFAIVCRTGNMSAAARELGVNQTTIARRLSRLEDRMGYALFLRDGYELRPSSRAQNLLVTAQAMEHQVSGLLAHEAQDQSARSTQAALTGTVRLTGVDAILENCVAPFFADLHEKHPGICLELTGSNRNLSLPQRESDLALRMARPQTGAFHIRKIGYLEYAIYGRASSGPFDASDPLTADRLETANWVDLDDVFADKPEQVWLNTHFPNRHVIARGNRASIMTALMAGQDAFCLLPKCSGDNIQSLTEVRGLDPEGRELWLLTHQERRHLPHVRAVADWLSDILPDGDSVTRR
ncbi:LysR family transcriptional regulator [Thalassospira sp. MA62]|nr:LysR family transcriptional regulator [Thalassospira sp. MA62]